MEDTRALEQVRLPVLMDQSIGRPEVHIAMIDGPIASEPFPPGRIAGTVSSGDCFHGTVVAALLATDRDAALSGICPGCTFRSFALPLRTAEAVSMADPETLAAAIVDAVHAGATVVNLSVAVIVSTTRGDRALELALGEAMRHGTLVVAAAGNEGTLGSSALTRHPWVIPVAACDPDGRMLALSNIGASISRGVAAPGSDVASLDPHGRVVRVSGTSIAAPLVSGTLALLASIEPAAEAARLRRALASPASRRAVIPPLLDARDALERVRRKGER